MGKTDLKEKWKCLKRKIFGSRKLSSIEKLFIEMYEGYPRFIYHEEKIKDILKSDIYIRDLVKNGYLSGRRRKNLGAGEGKKHYFLGPNGLAYVNSLKSTENAVRLNRSTNILLVVTFTMLIVSSFAIYSNYDIYKIELSDEMDNHIKSLKALDYELLMNLNLTYNLEKKRDLFLSNPRLYIFNEIITENLEKEASDELITSDSTRSHLFSTLYEIRKTNNLIKSLSNNDKFINNMTSRKNMMKHLLDDMETNIRDIISRLEYNIHWRITCLEEKRDYSFCYNDSLIIDFVEENINRINQNF